ncbi:MAG TPA: pilus assembly protein PilM, partial [Vicinamibacterales bacterium]
MRSSAGIDHTFAANGCGTSLAAGLVPIRQSATGGRNRHPWSAKHSSQQPLRGFARQDTQVFRRAKALVGLDIGSSAVKAVELKPAGKGYRVTGFGSEPIPPDSIVDGAIIDGAAVADAIRRLFDGRSIKTKDVAASLSGNAVIVKKITLPIMTEAELGESIYWEAEQYIPFDIQDVNLDYQILDKGDAATGGTMDV